MAPEKNEDLAGKPAADFVASPDMDALAREAESRPPKPHSSNDKVGVLGGVDNLSLGIITHPYYWDWERYPYRGIDRYNYELITALKKRGIDIAVYDSGYIHTHQEGIAKELIFPFRFFRKKARCFLGTHAMGSKWAILLGKKPVVTVIQDLLPFAYAKGEYDWEKKYAVKRWSIAYACKKSDELIVGYPSTKKEIIERFGTDPAKIVVVPYGIDHTRFFPGTIERHSPRRILFIGEAARAKGADSVLAAFSKLISIVPDAELKMASRGRDLEILKKMACDLGIADKTEFLGRVPEEDLPDLYRSADVFVFPSRHGFGLPTLEAMASGIPTISGKIFDAIDFVGSAGMLADPNNPDEIAHQMHALLTDDALWMRYREQGIARASQFSWDRMASETLAVCEQAAEAYRNNKAGSA